MADHIPVTIIGAGPTGLTAALTLARYQVPFRIIDKRPYPTDTSNALGVQPRTLEIWHDLGLIDDALAQGNPLNAMNVYQGNSRLAHIHFKHIESPYPFILGLPQQQTEAILIEHLKRVGIEVERQVECLDIQQQDETFELQVNNGTLKRWQSDWVLACDGSHSIVREKMGIAFEGDDLPEQFMMADVPVDSPLTQDEGHVFFSEKGPMVVIPMKDFARIILDITHEPGLKSKEHLQWEDFLPLIRKRCPVELMFYDAKWISKFHIHRKLANTFAKDRCLLLGDAAHIHSPVGGQGMNLGIQDAYNLAWKIAMIEKGQANDKLIASYGPERRPIAEDVLTQTTRATQIVTTRNKLKRFIRNQAVRVASLLPKANKAIAQRISQVEFNYAETEFVKDDLGKVSKLFLNGLKAGVRVPPLPIKFNGPQRLNDVLKDNHWKVFIFLGRNRKSNDTDFCIDLAQRLGRVNSEVIKCYLVRGKLPPLNDMNFACQILMDGEFLLHDVFAVDMPSLFLIRPDKHVAYRAQPITEAGFKQYCAQIGLILPEF